MFFGNVLAQRIVGESIHQFLRYYRNLAGRQVFAKFVHPGVRAARGRSSLSAFAGIGFPFLLWKVFDISTVFLQAESRAIFRDGPGNGQQRLLWFSS